MFADAIDKNKKHTRSVHFISRLFNSTEVVPGTATLFFVNDDGVAITCKHVADELLKCKRINSLYTTYKDELSLLPKDSTYNVQADAVSRKYGYTTDITAEYKSLFYDCAETGTDSISFSAIHHTEFDLSIIKISNATSYLYSGHAVFAKDSRKLRAGDFLCRIGYRSQSSLILIMILQMTVLNGHKTEEIVRHCFQLRECLHEKSLLVARLSLMKLAHRGFGDKVADRCLTKMASFMECNPSQRIYHLGLINTTLR